MTERKSMFRLLPLPVKLLGGLILAVTAFFMAGIFLLFAAIMPPMWPIVAFTVVYAITRRRLRTQGYSWTILDQIKATLLSIRGRTKFSGILGGLVTVIASAALMLVPGAPQVNHAGDVLLAIAFGACAGLAVVILVRGIAEARGDILPDEDEPAIDIAEHEVTLVALTAVPDDEGVGV